MTLVCDEHGLAITSTESLFVSYRQGFDICAALAPHDIDPIPESERLNRRRSPDEPGLDIYEGTDQLGKPVLGVKSFLGYWAPGKFLFSISGETAVRYLPRHYQSMIDLIRRQ